MPEGDTISRTARILHDVLAGRTVVRFETALPRLARVDDETPLRGRKHLIIHFSGDLTLRTHLRMNGSWHVHRSVGQAMLRQGAGRRGGARSTYWCPRCQK